MKTARFVLTLSLFIGLIGFTKAIYAPTVDRTSFSVKESDHFYELAANYDPDKTDKVQATLDDHLKQRGGMSFKNTQLDATMSLNDKTVFYIKSGPGKLLIKFDKRKNSSKALARFKKLGDDLRDLLAEK